MSSIEHLAGPSQGRNLDVVFLHGLNGDPRTAWRNSKNVAWPTWLASDFGDVSVWLLTYEASSTRWHRGKAMALHDRALNLLAQMQSNRIGAVPIVFVAHSMGGLVVKQMLRSATFIEDFASIASKAVGVAFLATPHSGANLADVAHRWRRVYRSTPAIIDLKKNSAALRDLNMWYQVEAHRMGLQHVVLREQYPKHGVLVVDESSADPHIRGVPCIAVDADHTTIAMVEDRNALVYRQICGLLERIIELLSPHGPITQGTEGMSGLDVPDRVALSMIEPPLHLESVTHWNDLDGWMSQRIERGRNFGSWALPFRGKVTPVPLGGRVFVKILTDRWYTQPEAWINEDGLFTNRIYIDERRPPMRFEIIVVDADGVEVNRSTARLE